MKKSYIISLQFIIIAALGAVFFYLFHTRQEIVEMRASLTNTITLMDELHQEKLEAEKQEKLQQEAYERMRQPLNVGDEAPDFSLQNINNETASLDVYRGKELLLVFAQPDCDYCKEFYPVLNTFMKKRSDVETLVIQMNADVELSELVKEKFDIQTSVFPATTDMVMDYKVQKTPATVLIDKEGKIAGKGAGNSLEDLMNLVGHG